MATTPIDLLRFVDRRDPQLLTAQNFALDRALHAAQRFDLPDPLRQITKAIEAARKIDLTTTQSYDFEAANSTAHTLASGVLEVLRDKSGWIVGALNGDIRDWETLVRLISTRRYSDYAVAGQITSRTFSVISPSHRGHFDDVFELEAWSAAVIFVLLKGPYQLVGGGGGPIDELSYVPSLGASFEHADQMRGEVEGLIGQLHRVAQHEATPDELSTMMTEHAKDGHRLFFGSDGAEREIPPMPVLVQGWVTGTVDLLRRVTDLTPAADEFADDLVADASPAGFRDALNKQLDHADIPEVLTSEALSDTKRVGADAVGLAAARVGEVLKNLVTPEFVTSATGIGWWISETFHLGAGSYLLSSILVLALLMRRQGPDGSEGDEEVGNDEESEVDGEAE